MIGMRPAVGLSGGGGEVLPFAHLSDERLRLEEGKMEDLVLDARPFVASADAAKPCA